MTFRFNYYYQRMTKLTPKTIISILLPIMVILLVVNFFLYYNPKSKPIHQKCPDEYSTDAAGTAESNTAFYKWTNDFYDNYPQATVADWSKARVQFWVDNDCKAALQRYKEAKDGTVDTAKMNAIKIMVSEMVVNSKYVSELGFSFNLPNGMSVMADPDAPRLFIILDSWDAKGDQDPVAVIITATPNDPSQTPLQWLNGPNSGADMSKGYTTIKIDGQEAISLREGTWVTVNTPDSKRQLSIATLPSLDPSSELIAKMKSIIDSLVFTR